MRIRPPKSIAQRRQRCLEIGGKIAENCRKMAGIKPFPLWVLPSGAGECPPCGKYYEHNVADLSVTHIGCVRCVPIVGKRSMKCGDFGPKSCFGRRFTTLWGSESTPNTCQYRANILLWHNNKSVILTDKYKIIAHRHCAYALQQK